MSPKDGEKPPSSYGPVHPTEKSLGHVFLNRSCDWLLWMNRSEALLITRMFEVHKAIKKRKSEYKILYLCNIFA